MRRALIPLGLLALTACAAPGPAQTPPVTAASAPIDRGRALAERICSACHAISGDNPGRNGSAPSFAAIRLRHNEISLEHRLGEVSRGGHYEMPRQALSENEISDLAAYIEAAP